MHVGDIIGCTRGEGRGEGLTFVGDGVLFAGEEVLCLWVKECYVCHWVLLLCLCVGDSVMFVMGDSYL